MKIMEELKTLELLCEAFGPSGIENDVTDIIKLEISPYSDCTEIDCCGNLTAHFSGSGQKARILLSSHTDEPALMIKSIDESGCLYFDALGTLDMRYLYGKRVTVGGGQDKISGIICSKPLHLLDRSEREKAPDAELLYIDIGASDRKEASELVSPGDCAVFAQRFLSMGDAVTAKALSDRFTSFAVIEAFKKMYTEKINTDYDIYAVFSSKSRVGYSNAASFAEKIKPDVVLSLTAEEICGGDDERASVFLPYKGTRLVYDRTFLRNLSDTAYKDTCRQDTFCENRIEYTSGKSEKILERNTEADFGSESYNADDSNRENTEKLLRAIPQANGRDEDILLQRVCGGTRICSIAAPCYAPNTGSPIMKKRTITEYISFLAHVLSNIQL